VIAYLEGQIFSLEFGYAILLTQGVGYQILVSKRELENLSLGQSASFYIHSNIREDAFELYGFSCREHKQIFQMLISVSGVGPKLGLSILSALPADELVSALIHADTARLSSISGIGKKTAERLALELKDKALKLDMISPISAPNLLNLQQAIRSLGYSKEQSEMVLAKISRADLQSLPIESLIKMSLRHLTGNP